MPFQQSSCARSSHPLDYISIGAFTAQIWDLIILFDDELDLLLTGNNKLVKGLYLWSRYFPIAAQLLLRGLADPLIAQYTSLHLCFALHISRAIAAQLTLNNVELILLIRVYALYNRSPRIRSALVAVFTIGLLLEVAGHILFLRASPGFMCETQDTSFSAFLLFGIGASTVQSSTVALIFAKYIFDRHTWSRTPVMLILIRDGAIISCLSLGIIAVAASYHAIRRMEYLSWEQMSWDAAFSWYLTLLSICGSRLILSMRKVQTNAATNVTRTYDLTEWYDINQDADL
ncbi:hypothetical protein AMATHDRAFT_1154 [Amanita thiersii Skay4041]|uniref:DUF6533 domain-containing protein n=1 Tax=Amanita thiersii Skay4041 TaxID=703135 RepID=A0A2A9NYE1_9AGAR|nr:hypothetical protein AMATHDRAFT_1154 [Amanita thiersii Skay4041]